MTFKSCATCIHVRVVKTVGNRKEMECRFNPPMPLMVPQNHPVTGQVSMGLMSAFAPVSDDVWCGQHTTQGASMPFASPIGKLLENGMFEKIPDQIASGPKAANE